ncbi:hypothetical protein QCN27_07295 [Cereibacter sp. SYSU M97828]|nr:hypothetical protein [Cereibacter flavus]
MMKAFAASAALLFAIASGANATTVKHVDAFEDFKISTGHIVQSYYEGVESVTFKFSTKGGLLSYGAGSVFLSDNKPTNIFNLGSYEGSWSVWFLDKSDKIKITFDQTFKGWLTFVGFKGHTKVEVKDYALAPETPPAPVPLPAAGLLLPMGVGALALLRRRKRAAA